MKKLLSILVLFISTTSSITPQWYIQNQSPNEKLMSISFSDSNNGLVVGSDFNPAGTNYILTTTDGGTNWSTQTTSNPQNIYNRDVVYFNSQNIWMIAAGFYDYGSRILKSTNGGIDWIEQLFKTYDFFDALYFLDTNNGWVISNIDSLFNFTNALYSTSDGGISWIYQDCCGAPFTGSYWDVFFTNLNNGWVVGQSGLISHTTDGGLNWQRQDLASTNQFSGCYFIGEVGWVVGQSWSDFSGKIFKTSNNGLNWIEQYCGVSKNLYSVFFIDTLKGFIVAEDGIILKTTDGGQNWIQQSSGSTMHLKDIYFIDNNNGWVTGNGGTILHTTNGGVTFIEENESTSAPNNFMLSQNYPNPFNPSTKISWQAPVSGWQTLKVYDVLGNEVATLVNEYRNAGSYEVEFKSSVGIRQLANGVYFYQLKAGDYLETKKMILLK